MAVSADDNGTVFDFQRDSVVISRLAQILRFPLECEKQSLEKGEHPEYREGIAHARQWFDRRLEQIRIDEMEEKTTICREYEEGLSQLEQEYAKRLKELEESFSNEQDEQKRILDSEVNQLNIATIQPSLDNGEELRTNYATQHQTGQYQHYSNTLNTPLTAISGKKFLRSRQNDVIPSSSGGAKAMLHLGAVGLGLTEGTGTVGGVKRRTQAKKSGSPFGYLGSGRSDGTVNGFSCAIGGGPTVGGTSISSLTIPCLLSESAISEDVNSLDNDSATHCILAERSSLGSGLCQDGEIVDRVALSGTALHSTGGEMANEPDKRTTEWRKVDESKLGNESALSRWIGSHSVELEVRGSVPANFKGFSSKKAPAQKVGVDKEPKKRGRPRLNPESVESPNEPRRPRGRPPKLQLKLNERLHSLVAESIAQRALSEKRSDSSVGMGRRTNNSLNVSLEMDQQRDIVAQQPFKIPKKFSQTPQQSPAKISLPTFKRPKVEPSDFELPVNFRANISVSPTTNFPPLVRPSSQRNAFQWAADRPCTSSSLAVRPPLTNGEGTFASRSKSKSSLDNLESAKHRESNEIETEKRLETSLMTNGSTAEDKQRKERRRDGPAEDEAEQHPTIEHNGDNEEGERHSVIRARVPIFTARTFNYELDVSSAVVKRFESAQVVDIFDSLPPPIDPRLKRGNEDGIRPTVPTLDRLVLRQGKCHQRTAQAFFCGGPLSALAICPRATKTGRELIAISTFADERMLKVERENQDAFVQLWTTNPKNLKETARFECLLRVPKAEHISSLNWCPTFDDDFEAFRKADSSEQKLHHSHSTFRLNFAEFTKESLGLLAVGTHNGRIHIFSVPSEFETLVDKSQNDGQETNSLPAIFESDPLFTLLHPPLSVGGIISKAPSYIWMAPSPDSESEKEQICASTLSNCHQIQNTCVSVCQLSGLCVSVGADGRMACSLNGRMAPIEGGDGENIMQGRPLLHLIMHNKSLAESEKNEQNFCFSHNDCCSHRSLEVRLGDCALLDQENERVCRRHAPEVCPGRRLESLTFCEFSRGCAGLTYCGGESGLVFIVPSTL